jgi:hypothetical protein
MSALSFLFIIFFSLYSTANDDEKLLRSAAPANNPRLHFKYAVTTIAGQKITRRIAFIDGIMVEGSDEIYTAHDIINTHNNYFSIPHAKFTINQAEAFEKALLYNTHSYVRDPYVEKIAGAYEMLWLKHFDELRPAYKTRPPTLSLYDLQDIYIDAENGDILKIEPAAHFIEAPASLFVFSPASAQLRKSDLKTVMLKDLLSIKEHDILRGKYISVRNCCRYFTCPEEGPCNDATKRCALRSHHDALQNMELVQVPTKSLGLEPLMSIPESLSVNAARCTYLPFARARYYDSNKRFLGFFEDPIDEPIGLESEMDRFSEVQAYHSINTFFNHIRFLLENPRWCLRESAMACTPEGDPVLDKMGNPVHTYKVFVNQMTPDMKLESNFSDSFMAQVMAGKGSAEQPIELKELTRMGNAAFIPALNPLKKSPARADEILSDLIKPYDHNVFFQGDRDFAYDGDVVFHEFMHAVTTSLVNKINTLGINSFGIHAEPGSLNEGWSDYFAAAFNNKSAIGTYAAIKDGYGETSLRDIDNNRRCPDDVIGEIHHDGLVWSGALWEIRKKVGFAKALEFDRAVLSALAHAKTTEDFKTQSKKLLASIAERPGLGPKIAQQAEEILHKRGVLNCFRAYSLSKIDKHNNITKYTKDILVLPSKNHIGLKNYAPSSSQFAIAIAAGTTRLNVSWRQYLGGTGVLIGTEVGNDNNNIIPLGIISNFDEPIKWHFNKRYAKPHNSEGPLNEEPQEAYFNNGRWHYSLDIDLADCEQRNLYLSLVSNDHKYIIRDVRVDFDIQDNSLRDSCSFVIHDPTQLDNKTLSCVTHEPWAFEIIILGLFWIFRRRWQRI